MDRTLDRGVAIGIGLVATLLVVNAAITYRNTRQLNEGAGWVTHTHEVIDLTSDVLRERDLEALVAAKNGKDQMDAIRPVEPGALDKLLAEADLAR